MPNSDTRPSSPILSGTKETQSQAALATWFAQQRLQSVQTLEENARHLITLCTTLLGALLGVMALASDPLPTYMIWMGAQWVSGAGVVCLFLSLACALFAIIPFRNPVLLNDPDNQEAVFQALLSRKSWGVWLSAIFFGAAMLCIVGFIIIALGILP